MTTAPVQVDWERLPEILHGLDRRAMANPWDVPSLRESLNSGITFCALAYPEAEPMSFLSPGSEGVRRCSMVAWPLDRAKSYALLRETDPGQWDLLRMATEADSRRLGLARSLIDAARQIMSPERILLEVREDNLAALAFYKSVGFRRLTLRRGYYRDGGHAVVMEWSRD